jgi:hypothetical protein
MALRIALSSALFLRLILAIKDIIHSTPISEDNGFIRILLDKSVLSFKDRIETRRVTIGIELLIPIKAFRTSRPSRRLKFLQILRYLK